MLLTVEAVVAEIVGEVDRRHATLTKLPLDAVAAAQGSAQPLQRGIQTELRV